MNEWHSQQADDVTITDAAETCNTHPIFIIDVDVHASMVTMGSSNTGMLRHRMALQEGSSGDAVRKCRQ